MHALLHTTVYRLRPSPCAVYDNDCSEDDAHRFREQMTPEQRVSTARFLGGVLQSAIFADRPMADLACQAILWCWTDDPDVSAAAEAHHRALRSYARQPHASAHYESRICAIEQAFAQTPYPSGPLMTGRSEEADAYALALAGVDWRALSPVLINHNVTAFSFMTPQAFRYFIPAALCHELETGTDVDLELHLVDRLVESWSSPEDIRQRVQAFSAGERLAIVDYLHVEAMQQADPDRLASLNTAMDIWESGGA